MKKAAYRYPLLSLLVMSAVAFFVPSVNAQTLQFGESFQLLNIGTLVGQNEWVLETNLSSDPQVVASTSCFAGKCAQFTSGATGSDIIGRSFPFSNYVSLYYQLRLDGTYAGAFDSLVSYFVSTTSQQFGVLGVERTSSTEFCVEYNAITSVACGLNYHENHLINVVVDMRNYPTCETRVSVNQGTAVTVHSGTCIAEGTSEINYRWQGLGSDRTLSIDNIAVSADPLFVTFSTTSAPFLNTNLDEYCGEIATSTGFIDSIGSSFSNGICRTFAYFFIPSDDSLATLQQTSDQLMSKIPFSYAAGVLDIYNELDTAISSSSTTNFPVLYLDLAFSSTTEQWFGNTSILLFSSSTINAYFPASTREGFRNLMTVVLWLSFAAYCVLLVNKLIHPVDLRN